MAGKQKKIDSCSGLVVITGQDPFLVSQECEKRLSTLLTADERAMALYEPRASEVNVADVLDELRTVPFLASRRVVLIKDAESFIKDNAEALERYLENPSPCGVLLMTALSWDGRLRISKKIQAAGCLVEIAEFKSFQLPAFVTTYAQQTHAIRLDASCCRLLIELVGEDPGRLCSEVDKLAIYVAPRKSVTAQDIEALVGHNRTFGAFEVIDSVVSGNAGPAIARLRNMFESDKDAEYTVVGAFGFHFRRLFRAKALMVRGTPGPQAALRSGVKFKQDEFLRQLDRLPLEQIAAILSELGRIDYGIKNGLTTAPAAIERLVLKVFSFQNK